MVITMTKISLRLCLGIALIILTQIILSQIGGIEFRARAQNPAAKPSKYATEYDWSISPAADLGQPGDKVINLPSCPAGVTGKEPEYWIYLGGPGAPEAAKVTGGTCAGDGRPGSLRFTTANAHAAGYSISSASSGLQEALIAARFTPTNPTGSPQSGTVIVAPGELKAFARVSVRASNITVDF